MDDTSHPAMLTHAADTVSAAAILGHFAGFLPSIATVGAIVWYGLQIWDWLAKRTARRHLAVLHRKGRQP
jgi:hypothetical protein